MMNNHGAAIVGRDKRRARLRDNRDRNRKPKIVEQTYRDPLNNMLDMRAPSEREESRLEIALHFTRSPQTRRLLESDLPGIKEIADLLSRGNPQDVFLKIYDITEGKANKYIELMAGFHVDGIWHTGLLSHGKERFYCDGPLTMDSEAVEKKFSLELRDIVYLGRTRLRERDMRKIMHKLAESYTPDKYDLITCNCNHFTADLMNKMRSKEIRRYGNCKLVTTMPSFITEQPQQFMGSARGRALIWLVENVLEKTDNFLNSKFAIGIDRIIQRLIKPPELLHPFDSYPNLPDVAAYALHVSHDGQDVPPDWVFHAISVVDENGVDWPMAPDKNLQDVWCCYILGPATDHLKLKLQLRDSGNIRQEELQVDRNVLEISEFNKRLCSFLSQNRNLRFFGRLFIEPPPENVYECTQIQKGKIAGWQLELNEGTKNIEIALKTNGCY